MNRRRGRCRCGDRPTPGVNRFGLPWRTCARCRAVDRAARAKPRAALMAIPKEFRRYKLKGRRGYLHAVWLYQCHLRFERRQQRKAAPVLPTLTAQRRAFVRFYVEQGKRNGERAALRAGYGVDSAANGGRAAAVYACRLLKRADIQKAIRELVSERAERLRAIETELKRRREDRAMLEAVGIESMTELCESMAGLLEDAGRRLGLQSKAAREARRWRRQAVLRLPGRCRCGRRADPGLKSCAPCRRERRHYRRTYRARRRLLRVVRR